MNRFIYGEDVEFENPREMVEFYEVAHKYNCKDAMGFSQGCMKKVINAKSAITFFETAVLYDISDLKESCLKVF